MTETTNAVNQSRYGSCVNSMEKTRKPNECNSTNYPNDEIEQSRPHGVADRTKQVNEISNTNIPLRNKFSGLRIEENDISIENAGP